MSYAGGHRAHRLERLPRRILLCGLLRRGCPDPDLLAGDHRDADEAAIVRRPLDVEHAVLHLVPGSGERLLQLGLVVDVTGAGELDPGVERVDDGQLRLLEAVLEIDGRDRSLEECGENVAASRDARQLRLGHVLRLLEQESPEVELLRDVRAAVTRDDVGPDLREPPFGRVGEPVVQRLRDRQLEHRVAEELEALVRGRAIRRPGRMGEDVIATLGGKGFDQARKRAPFPRAVAATGARRRSRQPGRRS